RIRTVPERRNFDVAGTAQSAKTCEAGRRRFAWTVSSVALLDLRNQDSHRLMRTEADCEGLRAYEDSHQRWLRSLLLRPQRTLSKSSRSRTWHRRLCSGPVRTRAAAAADTKPHREWGAAAGFPRRTAAGDCPFEGGNATRAV